MRFGFLTEGDTPPGGTHYRRYHELVEQVIAAERFGFDLFGASEQHLAIGGASTSSPETIYGYLVALTSRIRFSTAVALMPHRINHPIRTAERIATLDILSHGRMEAVLGRGNTMLALRAFEVSPEENKAEQEEGVDLIRAAFLDDPFSFVGRYYKVPPRSLVPKPVQYPHPPLALAATGFASHTSAATKGIGVVSFANFGGFEVLSRNLAEYDRAFDAASHDLPVNRSKGALISGLVCEETTARAREAFRPLLDYVKLAVNAYDRLADTSDDYQYTRDIKDHVDRHVTDVDYMIDQSASFVVGDPDDCVRQIRAYEQAGVETLWLRIDSMPHRRLLETIERFGSHVIPHFTSPHAVVRPPEDVLADIRRARPAHAERLARFTGAVRAGATPDDLREVVATADGGTR